MNYSNVPEVGVGLALGVALTVAETEEQPDENQIHHCETVTTNVLKTTKRIAHKNVFISQYYSKLTILKFSIR